MQNNNLHHPMVEAQASLWLAAITHTYLLFHCFPYVGYMTLALLPDEFTVDSVGWYAGLLGTAFTTGRCLGFIPWQQLRHKDTFGVKQSLLLSLVLSAICSLWFGLSTSFGSALAARFALGLSNTLSGCIKRIAIDRQKALAQSLRRADSNSPKDDEQIASKLEELAPARVLDIMWWGAAIGPGIGGLLSNPGTYSKGTWLPDTVEAHYPFLLPNIVGALLCLISAGAVAKYVVLDFDETISLPVQETARTGEQTRLLPNAAQQSQQSAITSGSLAPRYTTVSKLQQLSDVWKSPNARWHLIAYWFFSFVVVCIDEALPLFLVARLSGPGLSPNQIGWILTAAGLVVVTTQAHPIEQLFRKVESSNMLYPTIRVAALMGGVPSILIPFMLIINGGTYQSMLVKTNTTIAPYTEYLLPGTELGQQLVAPGVLHAGAFIFLALLLGWIRTFSNMYFVMIGVAAGRTVPPEYRDGVARVMTLGALCARAIAPAVAGILVSVFMTASWGSNDVGDAFQLWAIIGVAFGLGATMVTLQLKCPYEENESDNVKSRLQRQYLDRRQSAPVFAKLWELHDNKDATTLASKWSRLFQKVIPSPAKDPDTADESVEETGEISKQSGKRTSWVDHILRVGVDPEAVTFFILGTSKNDKSCQPHVLSPPLMEALHKNLPMSCSEDNFLILYSLIRDGAHMQTLEEKIASARNTIIAIETVQGDVFGCFMKTAWKRSNKYEMSGESFLWRLKKPRSAPTDTGETLLEATLPQGEKALNEIAAREGDIQVFRWTGENDECQLFSHDRIAAGGGIKAGGLNQNDGFGFIVEDGLLVGSSSPCTTYDNPSLVSFGDGQFEVANMEVWSMTPFLFEKDALKSTTSARFMEGNLTNTKGDAASAAQSAWTQFL